MLQKIKKIKGLGVFENYTASAEMPAFKRYNVIYGDNGSGKTTLSRLFGSLEAGSHPDYPGLDYVIETATGDLNHGQKSVEKIRVFNSDYVAANIGQFDGPIPHILIVGEENKLVAAELKSEITTLDGRRARVQQLSNSISKLEADVGKLFSQIAKTIGEATSGAILRNYRKPEAEAAFARLGAAKLLDEASLTVHRATVKQEQLEHVAQIIEPPFDLGDVKISVLEFCANLTARANLLGQRTAQSAAIERLAENRDIAEWVELGVPIHRSHTAGTCEFCLQPLPEGRMQALSDYFSEEDQILKDDIDAERKLVAGIRQSIAGFTFPNRAALYQELRSEYDAALQDQEAAVAELQSGLSEIDKFLFEKLSRRAVTYADHVTIDASMLNAVHKKIQDILGRHNSKTSDFSKAKQLAADAIAQHYLSTIKEQVDEISENKVKFQAELDLLKDGGEALVDTRSIEALTQSILEKQAKVSNAHAGGNDLTDLLKQFLGRTDIRFESTPEGYSVLRRGKPAKRLSEGEKTAVAFLYFLVQLRDQNFDLQNGIVVIDDPISSLDSSSIYQAFSFLKNNTQAAKQLVILTHNFEFLKLLLNWLTKLPTGALKKDCSFLMVQCRETMAGRSAELQKLDQLLFEHPSEYHYLFKILHTFESDGTIQGCYHVPNVARKVLETFLEFYAPSNKNLYQKLDEVDFDPLKKTAINKFANDLSHFTGKSFDPAIVGETQKNVGYLLEMIKAVSPTHYDGMKTLAEA